MISSMREAFRFSMWTAIALVGTGLLALVLVGVPRLLSDDPCLRDWVVECTDAGAVLQGLDIAGVFTGVLAVRVIPIVLAIGVASEAVQYGADRRRRQRAKRSARRVGEEPGS